MIFLIIGLLIFVSSMHISEDSGENVYLIMIGLIGFIGLLGLIGIHYLEMTNGVM